MTMQLCTIFYLALFLKSSKSCLLFASANGGKEKKKGLIFGMPFDQWWLGVLKDEAVCELVYRVCGK